MRDAARWFVPGGGVLTAAALLVTLGDEALMLAVSGEYRWAVYGLSAALAGGFHRSRVFTVVLGLGALDLVTGDAPELDALGALGSVFVLSVGVLALSRDRGVASTTGATQIGAITVAALVPGLIFYDSANVDTFTNLLILPAWTTAWTGYPQAAVLMSILGLAFAAYAVYRWQGVVERALVWCQITVFAAMHPDVGFPGDTVLLMAAGVILALAVLQSTYAMAYRDDLTGLPARRALERDLEDLSGTYTIAMVDVDHFKKFNDKHGHDVGDQVLRLVGTHLARGKGRAYRYGGEEFTLLFPGITTREAAEHLEEVRAAVERARFALRSWNRPRERPSDPAKAASGSKTLSVTVSIGAADSSGGETDADEVVKNADLALYRAKEAGRNRVSV